MLSIVCPIYNEVEYIKGCIESIVAQDYPKDSLEVLFVDGMSSDGTRDVVRKFISKASSRQKNSPDPFQGAQRKNRALR
jgi:glycosyltransferase involved in cell wall biosynthesis